MLQSAARIVLIARRGPIADQIAWLTRAEPPDQPPPVRTARATDPIAVNAVGIAVPRVLQRPRRLRQGWPGICDEARGRRHDTGTMDQRDRQCRLWLSGVGRGKWLHLGRQQPREPADALVERPCRRPDGGSPLHPRRSDRRSVEPDRAAHSRRRVLCCAPRLRLQPVRARGERHFARIAAIRPAGRSDQDFAADAAQCLRPAAQAVGDGLCRMGARYVPRRFGTVHRDRRRPRDRGDPGAQPVEHRHFPDVWPLPISVDGRRRGPPIAASSSVATAGTRHRRGWSEGPRYPVRPAPGSTPVPPCSASWTLPRENRPKSSGSSDNAAQPKKPRPSSAATGRPISTPFWTR